MTTLTASSQLTDGCDVAMATAIDRLIRISTAVAVLAVASVAAYVSYWHAYAVVRTHGESGPCRQNRRADGGNGVSGCCPAMIRDLESAGSATVRSMGWTRRA